MRDLPFSDPFLRDLRAESGEVAESLSWVAAEVTRLKLSQLIRDKCEPPHVGCYGELISALPAKGAIHAGSDAVAAEHFDQVIQARADALPGQGQSAAATATTRRFIAVAA